MWNNLGGSVGWTVWLMMPVALLAFWGAAIVGLCALLRIPSPTDRTDHGARTGDLVSRHHRQSHRVCDISRSEPIAPCAVGGSEPTYSMSNAEDGEPV